MLHLIKLLFNKDVLVFLIQMQYKKWKKQFITKGGWKKPKSIIIILLCKSKERIKQYLLVIWALYTYCKSKGWLPKKSIRGDHAYITGGGSGLGRLMAIRLVEQGCFVTITDVNEQGLIETSKNIE